MRDEQHGQRAADHERGGLRRGSSRAPPQARIERQVGEVDERVHGDDHGGEHQHDVADHRRGRAAPAPGRRAGRAPAG